MTVVCTKINLGWKGLTRPLGRPKNRWEDDIRNDMKKLKIKSWTSYIQYSNNWILYVEKAKRSTTEVVAPKEEEEGTFSSFPNIAFKILIKLHIPLQKFRYRR